MSNRIWKETIPPKLLHDKFGIYHGAWVQQMDRCWNSDDGYQVCTRLIQTEWGKIEHATIKYSDKLTLSMNGENDIPWKIKQEIKNELFGENRVAIEVFPTEKNKIDVMDIYHLWVFPKNFKMPFGIHPKEDKQCKYIPRGVGNIQQLVDNSREMFGVEY